MRNKFNKKGFTLIEIVLVMAILGIMVSMGAFYYKNSQLNADINTQAKNLVSNIRLAQSNSASGIGGSDHGVHLEQQSYVIFAGDVYDPNDTENITTDLSETISILNINLNGGGSDIIFSSPLGATGDYGTFDLVAENINKTITIQINNAGAVNY